MFKGSIVALVTPFKDNKVDEKTLRELVEFQIENKTDAIVPCGSTGESATLSTEEHCKVIEIVVEQVKGRVPVLAGTGSNSTSEAIYFTEHAKKTGADGALLITPYYNKPTQEGLYRHFCAIAESVDIPIVVYNVPSRTGINMLPETVVRLSHVPNIIGIKEASGSLDQAGQIMKNAKKGFSVLSGEDSLTFPMIAMGAMGVISVANNITPKLMHDMCALALQGDMVNARELHYKLHDLCAAVFYETNPIPVKKALYLMGMIEDEVRMPLITMTEGNTKRLIEVLKALDIKLVNEK